MHMQRDSARYMLYYISISSLIYYVTVVHFTASLPPTTPLQSGDHPGRRPICRRQTKASSAGEPLVSHRHRPSPPWTRCLLTVGDRP